MTSAQSAFANEIRDRAHSACIMELKYMVKCKNYIFDYVFEFDHIKYDHNIYLALTIL